MERLDAEIREGLACMAEVYEEMSLDWQIVDLEEWPLP